MIMRKLDLINRRWFMAAAIAIGLLVIASPIWSWYLKSEQKLNVLIVDKTVPDTSYRSHAGLTWMLNNSKIVQPSGKAYDPASNYYGFKPLRDGKYRIDAVPDHIDNYDLIYLANMYGVDKEPYTGKEPSAAESKSLYGGMTKAEFEPIRDKLLTKGGTLIAEYNLLGKPTSPELRGDMYSLLNLTWDGWSYKYVADLAGSEVPDKLKASVAAKANGGNGAWTYTGSGYLFMNEFTEENLVLREADLAGGGSAGSANAPTFAYTSEGEKQLALTGHGVYTGWVDVVKPADETEVLATYTLGLSPSGQEKLNRRYIPLTMPAIIHHQNDRYGTYYFNGQFSVNTDLPPIYQSSIQTALRKLPTWHDTEDAFYWDMYIPLMKAIIDHGMTKPAQPLPVEKAGTPDTSYSVRVSGNHFQTLKNGKWTDFIVKGVNIGMGKPGAFPGNAAIGRDEYYRWFQQIAAMNANAIRVYTLQPPAFYEALYEFNQTTDKPLCLFHGAWVLEDALVASGNAFSDAVMKPFHEEIENVANAVHGKANLPKRAGHSYGSYTYDVSPYLLGWILGIEWDPNAVADTNKQMAKMKPWDGRYMYTKSASPFENWLAQGMEYMAAYEQEHYHVQHALSFTNWPTTDMLKHPLESFVEEDMSVVNPNHIYTKDSFYPGSFASYHVYPYYPDFMNNEYKNYVDATGSKNNYAGYLHALKSVHRLPILVAEFGIPSSRGMTHRNVEGKDQGHHSEQEQGRLVAGLYEDMLNEGYMGGMIFSWQDEWFKRTWNTMDYDNAHRRPFWSNVQTNEQYFGLLSFDPGENTVPIDVDGDTLDWDALHLAPIYKAAADSKQNLKALYMTNDSAYVYLRLDYGKLSADDIHTSIMLDTVPGQGNTKLPGGIPLKSNVGFDFYIDLASASYAEMFVNSYYDTFYYDYAYKKQLIPTVAGVSTKNNGMYNPIRLVLNKGSKLTLPSGKVLHYPFESYHTGRLQLGNSNSRSADYNSLADYNVNEQNGVVELRIPWLMLNAKDPSLHEMTGDLWASGKGYQSSVTTKGFHMLVTEQQSGNPSTLSTLPELTTGETVTPDKLSLFQWGEWNQPYYHERLKQSYYVMQKEYGKY